MPRSRDTKKARDESATASPAASSHAAATVTAGKASSSAATLYAVAAVAAGKLQSGDLDENVQSFLANMKDDTLAKGTIDDFAQADLTAVKSRPGYLLGMLRQRLRKRKRDNKKQDYAANGPKPKKPVSDAPAKAGKKEMTSTPWNTLFVNQVRCECAAPLLKTAPHTLFPWVPSMHSTGCEWAKRDCGPPRLTGALNRWEAPALLEPHTQSLHSL
jgi:hypothetical protein